MRETMPREPRLSIDGSSATLCRIAVVPAPKRSVCGSYSNHRLSIIRILSSVYLDAVERYANVAQPVLCDLMRSPTSAGTVRGAARHRKRLYTEMFHARIDAWDRVSYSRAAMSPSGKDSVANDVTTVTVSKRERRGSGAESRLIAGSQLRAGTLCP